MARRSRSDSTTNMVQTFAAAQRGHGLKYPDHATKLPDADQQSRVEATFGRLLSRRHPDDWTVPDLDLLAETARLEILVADLMLEVAAVGGVIHTSKGPKVHPSVSLINSMNNRRNAIAAGLGLNRLASEEKRTLKSRASSFNDAGRVIQRTAADSLLAGFDQFADDLI